MYSEPMTARVQLTEDMKRLMGIKSPDHGGLPAMFQPSGAITEGAKAKPRHEFNPYQESASALEERRNLSLFKTEADMQNALNRAHKLIARVNATVQHDRNNSTRGQMQEKTRAEMYRLDQELATSMDAVNAANEAIGALVNAKKEAKRHQREQRRQGRR